jgi:hypothetical protein
MNVVVIEIVTGERDLRSGVNSRDKPRRDKLCN